MQLQFLLEAVRLLKILQRWFFSQNCGELSYRGPLMANPSHFANWEVISQGCSFYFVTIGHSWMKYSQNSLLCCRFLMENSSRKH